MKASELKGHNRCYERRLRDITLTPYEDDRYEKAVLQKRLIKACFISRILDGYEDDVRFCFTEYIAKNATDEDILKEDLETVRMIRSVFRAYHIKPEEITEDEATAIIARAKEDWYIEEYIHSRYEQMDFPTQETAIRQAKMATKRVLRYLHYETRTPMLPEMKTLDLFGLAVDVKPDLLFFAGNGDIEAVKICCKKPDVTEGGRKKDKGVRTSLELFAIYEYAKAFILDEEKHDVKGSYYFLGRADDKKEEMPDEFWSRSGSRNILSLSCSTKEDEEDRVERIFKPQFEEFELGESCTGDACENCDLGKICNFQAPPLTAPEETKEKTIADLLLTKEQERAIDFRKGIARINAGAGAGKTLVTALRMAMMFSEGVKPEEVLLITFTEAGAKELKERVKLYSEDLMVEVDWDKFNCLTFNSFGDQLIKEYYKDLGFTKAPRLIDEIERKEVITEILEDFEIPGIDYKNFLMDNPRYKGALMVVATAFSIIKKNQLSKYKAEELQDLLRKDDGCWNAIGIDSAFDLKPFEEMLKAYAKYDAVLHERNLIEFADQEVLLFDLLALDGYFFDLLGYKHIVVDEFQDSSENQIMLIKKLTETDSFESLMVVGDDSQSIFGFRDAVPENIINFFEKIDDTGEDIFLMKNHRSTPEILDFANEIIRRNANRVEKDLIATRASIGKPVVVKGFLKKDEEYSYILETVKEKLNEYAPEEIAIITATRKELLEISGVLSEAGVKTALLCPEPMLDNSRIQAIVSTCNMLQNINATQDIAIYINCVGGGNLLESSDNEITEKIEEVQEMIREFWNLPYKEKAKTFDEMIEFLAEGDSVAANLVERLKRFRDVKDKYHYVETFVKYGGESVKREGRYNGISLTTAHSAKGLEWPVVINSITKYDRKNASWNDREERRRLLFVSATRARDELYITGQIFNGGNMSKGDFYPNEFLAESETACGMKLSAYDQNVWETEKKERVAAKEKRAAAKKAI